LGWQLYQYLVMGIPCRHWRDCGVLRGGCCAIDAYDKPSFGVCLSHCTKYKGPPRGAGDLIERTIKMATFGKAKKCKDCGNRQIKANKLWVPPHVRALLEK
jgi:hypothetical protein